MKQWVVGVQITNEHESHFIACWTSAETPGEASTKAIDGLMADRCIKNPYEAEVKYIRER